MRSLGALSALLRMTRMGRENSGQTERSSVSRRSGDWTAPLDGKRGIEQVTRHLGGLVSDCVEGSCGREVPFWSAERAPQDDKAWGGKTRDRRNVPRFFEGVELDRPPRGKRSLSRSPVIWVGSSTASRVLVVVRSLGALSALLRMTRMGRENYGTDETFPGFSNEWNWSAPTHGKRGIEWGTSVLEWG